MVLAIVKTTLLCTYIYSTYAATHVYTYMHMYTQRNKHANTHKHLYTHEQTDDIH